MQRYRLRKLLKAFLIPIAFAIILRLIFGTESWNWMFSVMSVTFLFCLPLIVGFLTVFLSGRSLAKIWVYRIFAPWVPIIVFTLITLFVDLEGWACWMMILPAFLVEATIGGILGGYIRLRKRSRTVHISLIVLLPFVFAPIEQRIGSFSKTYEAYTYIDINSTPEKIWDNVTRVRLITEEQDKGWLTRSLGFPRPLSAELDSLGVGGYRKAYFTKGLVFHETVTEYVDRRKMAFTIKAYPHEIPSTTMDEHVVIGGDYFDVLDGIYELEELNESTYRLHLSSRFRLYTTFNFYAGFWAKWIMKDIQNNILQVEKMRAETQGPL